MQEIQKENPSLRLPGSDAVKGYTARVISNLGGFAKDFQKGKFGATKDSVKQIEKAVDAADKGIKITSKPEEPAADATVETYEKDEFPTKVPEYRKIFDELGDTFTVKKGQDLYDSAEFRSSVDSAVETVLGKKDEGEANDFIETLKFYRDRNKINPYVIAGSLFYCKGYYCVLYLVIKSCNSVFSRSIFFLPRVILLFSTMSGFLFGLSVPYLMSQVSFLF